MILQDRQLHRSPRVPGPEPFWAVSTKWVVGERLPRPYRYHYITKRIGDKHVLTSTNHIAESHRSVLLCTDHHHGADPGRVDHRWVRVGFFHSQSVGQRFPEPGIISDVISSTNNLTQPDRPVLLRPADHHGAHSRGPHHWRFWPGVFHPQGPRQRFSQPRIISGRRELNSQGVGCVWRPRRPGYLNC